MTTKATFRAVAETRLGRRTKSPSPLVGPHVACLLFFSLGACASTERIARVQQENDELRTALDATQRLSEMLRSDLTALADASAAAQHILELRESLEETEGRRTEVSRKFVRCDTERGQLAQDVKKARATLAELRQENERLRQLAADVENPLVKVAIVEWKLVERLQGAAVIAQNQDKTYLGIVDFAGTLPDSIFNDVGLHGSAVGLKSIWNDVGFYGSEVGLYSARNDVCINPPMLVKHRKVIAYVTTNDVYVHTPRFDPYYLRSLARRLRGDVGIGE